MKHRTRYMRLALPAALLAAVLAVQVLMTDATANAGQRPVADGLLPSLPVPLPPVPSVPLPTLPLPTTPPPAPPTATTPPAIPGIPGLPGLPGQPGQGGQPGQPGQPAPSGGPAAPAGQPPAGPGTGAAQPEPGDVPGVVGADAAAAIIANDPGADLYPQPRVDPVTNAQSLLVARLNEVQHRVQYLQNVLIRTRADLSVARDQLDSAAMLITVLVAPVAAGAPSGNAVDGPQGRVLALSSAVASGEADLARSESAVQTLQQQVNRGVQMTIATAPQAPTTSANYGGGRLRRPVPGRIGSPFGNRFDPYYHRWQLHAGADMVASFGSNIVAAATGRVIRAGWAGGYGNYTCIDHGQFDGQRLSTCYAHQSAILVKVGQQVTAGEVIGRVGSTGASTGPHLHFEVRLGGRPVDPAPWL